VELPLGTEGVGTARHLFAKTNDESQNPVAPDAIGKGISAILHRMGFVTHNLHSYTQISGNQ
jgi:hypothetical protein